MADTFFGFDTSVSNLNDDEGGGGPSEDEYDALNDETFGQDSDTFDWEVEHEQLAGVIESSRRYHTGIDDAANTQLEASLSQLVLDETDAPQSRSLESSVWRHDGPFNTTPAQALPTLKNVCTVEELERQLRQKQPQQQHQNINNLNFYQPRFPVILQRPPGLQAPVPLPFAQQPMSHNMPQMNQPLNKIVGQNTQMNQMGQNNQLIQNQLGQNVNQLGQNVNQMNQMGQNVNHHIGQNVNQFMQNAGKMSNQYQNNQMPQNTMMNQLPQNMQNINQMGQNNQMLQNVNQMGQNFNQMGQNVNQLGQNVNQLGQNVNQLGQNVNQMGQNVNQMGQNVNQIRQNVNQNIPNGNQFGPGMNQFPHMMGQPRMMAPPPGLSLPPRQNFNSNMGQFNPNFRPQSMPTKQNEQHNTLNQQQGVLQQQQQQQQQQQLLQKQQQQQQQQQQIKNQTQQTVKTINQSPQNQCKTPQNRQQDSKIQKTRVYNNSSQQNSGGMSSQNLVQLIQNTHPMLQQYNTGYHNASHHPMLANRPGTYNGNNGNQFTNNLALNNQRHNGAFNNNSRVLPNGEEGGALDEYAGLMSAREKQWLINIQILQLNTGTPYIHDFYYTVFLERQAQKEKEGVKEAHKANQQNHPFYSGAVGGKESFSQHQHQRERHNSARHNSLSEDAPPRAYVPTQFENSLGKLQCGSVTAPRKIIDVELVGGDAQPERPLSRASTLNTHEVPREVKRTKQVLLDIEALYLVLLRLEELNDPLAISNALILKEREEKQRQLELAQKEALESEPADEGNLFLRNIESVQRRPRQDSPKSEGVDKRQVVNLAVSQKPAPAKNLLDEDKDELIGKMFAGLLHSDRLALMLTVRKGRTLVRRFLSRVGGTHSRLRALWARVLRALPAAARRDDGGLAALAQPYDKYIQNTSGWSAILESCGLLAEAFDPARTPHALTTAFTLSCVCSLMARASLLVNTPEATSSERQWYKFLKTLARALRKNTTLAVAKPLHPLPEAKLTYHMKQLESRTTIEILQRGKTAAEFADMTKNEVAEQLRKYLC